MYGYEIEKENISFPNVLLTDQHFPLCGSALEVLMLYMSAKNLMDVWLFEYDGDLHLEDATTDEVADCRWMTVSEISI